MGYTVGGDVDAHCTKCKMELAHVIVAMVDTRPKRVECKTCGSTHNYRSNTDVKEATKRKTKRTTTKAAQAQAQDYETALAGRDIASAQRYRITEEFQEGAVVDHKKFGLGVVTRVLSGSKIEVIFREGSKTLVHQRAAV